MNKKHNHFIIKFNKFIKLIYNDVRKFGFIKLISPNQYNKITILRIWDQNH